MDWLAELRQDITKEQLGIEIGPRFSPVVPKRGHYNSLGLGIFDAHKVRALARENPGIPDDVIPNIENVDLVGVVANLLEMVDNRGLVGQIDYSVSSHNCEHIPDPILFLQACEKVLKSRGVLSMALLDRRASLDYFRPHTTTGDPRRLLATA
jgi:SAM-dependent methyltransferase